MAKKWVNFVKKLGTGTLLLEAVREHVQDSDFIHRGNCLNADHALKTGTYLVNAASTNVPHNYGLMNVYRRNPNEPNYTWQEIRTSNDVIWTRVCWNGTWTAWKSRS